MGVDLLAQRAGILLSKEVHHVVVAQYANDEAPAGWALRVLDRDLGQT
jgi:hypothetical protein